MEIWTPKVMKSPSHFLCNIDSVHPGEPLLIEFTPTELSDELVRWHQENFRYQHTDTIRSYTKVKLRARGNHGKRVDFSYLNRAKKYFGYDQFESHRAQPNKLICIWDPSKGGDYVGEHNPCMVLVKFQRNGSKLDMRVVFRKRELLSRMVGNWFMLGHWLNHEAGEQDLKPGLITDFSMDTSYEPDRLKALRKAL